MAKITAQEARELAGPTVQERVDGVFELIREAATKKFRRINLTDKFWEGGYDKSPEWLEAKALLEKEGFTVEFFYEERQFVNMYTIVKW